MDPKSCRPTPHRIIAMICSLPLILISIYNPSFVFLKNCVFELNVSCFVDDRVNNQGGSEGGGTRVVFS